MPLVNIDRDLPSLKNVLLENKDIVEKGDKYDLRIGILNLMPTKSVTEEQFFKLLGTTEHKCQVDLVRFASHKSKTTDEEYLVKFYKDFSEVKNVKYDGFIITGAPVEKLDFSEVTYWEELKEVLDWTKENDIATVHICWGAQAGLYHHYNIKKVLYTEKLFGIYKHEVKNQSCIFRDFPNDIEIPQSRYTGIDADQLSKEKGLVSLDANSSIGASIFTSKDDREIYILGHLEYDTDTLEKEYLRDKEKGLDTKEPHNYYHDNKIENKWHTNAKKSYKNWLDFLTERKA